MAHKKTLEALYKKKLKTIETRSLWYPSYFGFLAILNALSCNILSEAVTLIKKRLQKVIKQKR